MKIDKPEQLDREVAGSTHRGAVTQCTGTKPPFIDNRSITSTLRQFSDLANKRPAVRQQMVADRIAGQDKVAHGAMLQRRQVIQRVVNLMDMAVAIRIAGALNVKADQVFKVMITLHGKRVFDEEDQLKTEVAIQLNTNTTDIEARDRQTFVANRILQEFFESSLNQEILDFISKVGSMGGEYVVLYRGANPAQALKIMSEQTLGGASEIMDDRRDPPTEQMQILQTGYKIKEHEDSMGGKSTLEEWSRGIHVKDSFGTGGWVLNASLPSPAPIMMRAPKRADLERRELSGGWKHHAL